MDDFTFRLLGPVRAWRAGTELEIGPPQQQAVLAVLLLARGAHVSMASMLDALWGEHPPKSGAGAVRTYVSRLRQILNSGEAGAGIVIEPIGDGYALRGERVSVDADVFEERVTAAMAARRAGADAADLCRRALAEWRGEPLVGVPGPYFDWVRARLTELRADAAEIEAAAQVEAGDHLAAIAGLRTLITTYPLRESLHELLMLALYRAGRQADALEVYERARRVLRDELGIEPGPALKRMQLRVLSADDALAPLSGPRTGVSAVAVRRRQVGGALAVRMIDIPPQRHEPRAEVIAPAPSISPAPSDDPAPPLPGTSRSCLARQLQEARRRAFVGREAEIAAFRSALGDAGRAFTLLFVTGPGGVGKTTLLRRFAEESAEVGRTVVELDAVRDVECTQSAFEAAASRMLAPEAGRATLLVDGFEMYQPLEPWLREDFLPRLPLGTIVVLAGRTRPAREWRSDPAWHDILDVVELGDLSEGDARQLLAAREVPAAQTKSVLAFAGGNPLALSLAADSVRRDESADDEADWAPSYDVIGALVDQLVGDAPSAEHRQALDVCALLPTTNEELLRAALPDADTPALFAWLRELPFIESGPLGVYPHDVVREILDADLKWRDPERHQVLRARVLSHLGDMPPEPDAAALSREEFNAAVRSALRAWHRPDTLADSLLHQTNLVASDDDNVVPAERVRAAISLALRQLREDRHGEKQYLAITCTYLDADAKQQHVVAQELGLPFGTYRRHLAQGLDRVCELLWHRHPVSPAG
ncbi:AAA family ATPase [Actinospica sp. MGRD01-02]|uniref:AAA family ATPase n=1 Tax=Actinospica acidithermotolerans TaxID=2828514 RepID=A0A941ED92_9ACTN|nr:BTAD domain-containing putative transcriptional regulator [Actinospica acidithermotolerans]MBR7829381.1 AAA family ATPase [Actinospica acidithermotolerans]